MFKGRKNIRICLLMILSIIVLTTWTDSHRALFAKSEETYEGLKVFSDVIEEIENNYVDQVDSKELVRNAIQGMVHSLDPHSQYLPPKSYKALKADTKGEFGGIGIVITMPKGILTVISPIEGTPADRAGVQSGDIIIEIDGEYTKDMKLWDAVDKMRGKKGTPVIITITRKGVGEPIEFTLVRDIIPVISVKSTTLKPGFAYIRITNFQDKTTKELENALNELEGKETQIKGLILDLRNNPGGLLNESVSVSDLFLDKGTILSIKGRHEKNTNHFTANPNKVKREYPIVLLINSGSASASEIVAGALQDNKRALILGTTSFGKGSVQTVKPLRDGAGLKYTIARYYTPSGKSIQAKGIEPDIVVKQMISIDENDNDDKYMKEKDLKNHLQAEPEKDKKTNKKTELEKTKYGSLNLDKLKADNQISRALDILVSYGVFTKLKNAYTSENQKN
ncbi:MAG: S41 family peptidase [Desulfobacterales bacterium]|nr:S41 family peptidase [Desulfobacterales bacterium]